MDEKPHMPPVFGFLVIGTLLGAALGFSSVDIVARLDGYDWSSPLFAKPSLTCTAVGMGLGIAGGLVADAYFKRHAERSRVMIRRLWWTLVVVVLLYWIIGPVCQRARE